MTDSSELERAAEEWERAAEEIARLDRGAEALQEQLMPVFRSARQFVDGLRAARAEMESVTLGLRKAMDLGTADIAAAVQRFGGLAGTAASISRASANLSGSGSLGGTAVSTTYASANLAAVTTIVASGRVIIPKPKVVADGDVATATESASVAKLEDIGELTARARRDGIAGFSYNEIFIVAVVLVLLFGVFVVVPDLSSRSKAELGLDFKAIAAAFALVAIVISNRRR